MTSLGPGPPSLFVVVVLALVGMAAWGVAVGAGATGRALGRLARRARRLRRRVQRRLLRRAPPRWRAT